SISGAMIRRGTRPACLRSSMRRGLALAKTNPGLPRPCETKAGMSRGFIELFEPVGDAALGEVVRSHFDEDLVPHKDADAVLAHLARGMRDDLVAILELHPERSVGEKLGDHAWKFEQLFFCHSRPLSIPRMT